MRPSAEFLASVPATLRSPLRCALATLWQAFSDARVSQRDPWEFAVRIADLRAAGVTNAALCILVSNGFVQHAVEGTKSGKGPCRLATLDELLFCDKSSFVLTKAGARAMHPFQAGPVWSAAETPYWHDGEHTLFWRGQALKHYKSDAPYQEAVLRTFQAQLWQHYVTVVLPEDPGVNPKERMHDTIKNLNRNTRPQLRFRQEGSGSRVCWEPMSRV